MTGLWLAIMALLLIAVVILLLPLLLHRNVETVELDEKQRNIDIFKDRLAELEQEKAIGNLDEDDFLQLKIELEKSLLSDVKDEENVTLATVPVETKHWMVVAAMSVVVIAASLGIYMKQGRSDDYGLYLTMKENGELDSQIADKAAPSFEKIIAMLEEKLQKDPADLEKWFLLANSHSAMGNFDKAAKAFSSAAKQMAADDPNLAAVKGSYAQMLFQAAGETVTPEVEKAMLEALSLDPLESSALVLKGIQVYTAGDLKGAIGHWEKAKTKASEHLLASFIEPVIAQTKKQLGEPVVADSEQAHAHAASIEVKLDIKDELKAKAKAEDVIFVFAQQAGGKMPLAAHRLQIRDLPAKIVLDDSKSPMPAAKLSSAEYVDITARVSFSGHPKASKGDLFAVAEKVKVGDTSVLEMVIGKVVE